jgi:hypothetical protein
MRISDSIARLGAIAALAAAVSLPALAQGRFSGPGWYQITNEKTNQSLTLAGDGRLVQAPARGGEDQAWVFEQTQNGFFFIRSARNGSALEPTAGQNSSPVLAAPFHGGQSQQWRIENARNGNAMIVNSYGRTLDIPEGSGRPGLAVQIFDRTGDNNQRFVIAPMRGNFGGGWRGAQGGSQGGPQGGPPREAERGRGQGRSGEVVRCSSENNRRTYCEADTRGGVLLLKQLEGRACRLNETWGFDAKGIWVDRGCRGEFQVNRR